MAHRDVLCARSGFFKAACSLCWAEGQHKIVPLSEVEGEIFQMYMDLAYHRLVWDNKLSSLRLVKLYVSGDFLDNVKARNTAMRLLLNQRSCPSPFTVDFIWDHTLQGSILRQWAVDMIAAKLGAAHFARIVGWYPAEFIQQIAVKLYQHAPADFPYPSAGLRVYLEGDLEGDR